MNSEGRHTRSAGGADREHAAGPGAHRRPNIPPDDRQTTLLPPVRNATEPHLRDPIDVVKAALDGSPPRKPPPPAPPRPPAGGPPPRPPKQRPQFQWKWVRRAVYVGLVLFLVLPFVTFAMAYLIVEVPKPGDIRTAQVSTILASDGSELARIVPPEGNRNDVSINQIPVHVRDAVMAAEDRDFYSNPGFSLSGFARAFKNNIFGGDLQGGSTITQQYVKNALVGDARSGLGGVVRKAKELVISTKMSREWGKDQVLESYLNIIYFGRGAYGISAAAKAYFDKPVEQLDVAEGALLAALIQRPSTLDPAVDPEGAADRWNWVLDGMVDIGALSKTDRTAQVFPPTVPPEQASQQDQTTGPNGLIERQVTKELLDLFNINEQTLNTEGLQVTTTIDPAAQKAAEESVTKTLD
ncbi:MAG: transglycosylase domain-containing protein, partial [Mycobacterium sp.]